MKISNRLKVMLKSVLALQMGEIKTDKAVLVFDGDEIAEGIEVFVQSDEDVIAAEDGEYAAEDGRIIVVADGKVAEIREAENKPEEEPEKAAEDVENAIENEPAAEPAAEPAEEPAAEPNAEDRIAALEAQFADYTAALNEIINAISAFEGRIAELENKIAKVEAEPAAEPAEEPAAEEMKKTRLSYLRKN